MPTILRLLGFRFHFYSDEGNEPAHIHVTKDDCEIKFWLDPVVIARNRGMTAKDIRIVERLVIEHRAFLQEQYHEFHGR